MLEYRVHHNGRPYLVDLLDVRYTLPEADLAGADLIDEWVCLEIARRELRPTKEAYRDIVHELSKKLGISKHSDPLAKLHKINIVLTEAAKQQKMYAKLGIDLKSLEELLDK